MIGLRAVFQQKPIGERGAGRLEASERSARNTHTAGPAPLIVHHRAERGPTFELIEAQVAGRCAHAVEGASQVPVLPAPVDKELKAPVGISFDRSAE